MTLPPCRGRAMLMIGASLATLAAGLSAAPVQAQTAAARLAARVGAPRPQVQAPGATPLRSPTARGALARQRATLSRTEQIRSLILSARVAATGSRPPVSDGLAAGGLDPTDTIREAIAAARAGDPQRAQVLLVSAGFSNDATGLKTWEGAGLPSQATVDGKVQVTIDQTQERALLSWNSFNIGANTTLQFNQKSNGVAQPGWVAVNRVADAVAPSQILGNLKADGTVMVLNRQGILFGASAQVNTHSLLASTLELGNAMRFTAGLGTPLRATTIAERNGAFLQNGLFGPANGSTGSTGSQDGDVPLLVSALLEPGQGPVTSPRFATQVEGAITVDSGARLTAGAGGFLMLTAPVIESAGILRATDGQVSLQAGRAVSYVASTGAATDADPNVRGYRLNSLSYIDPATAVPRAGTPDDGVVRVSGLIESRRGYLSLGTGAFGSVDLTGMLAATTSVSRNGKIAILSGNVTLGGNADAARAAGIEILADASGETIPIGTAAEPATFKASQIEIGTQLQSASRPFGERVATNFTMGQNAVILAPGANVSIGATTLTDPVPYTAFPGKVDIASGAMIDVSGLKDVQLDASRNAIEITPVKRNELRDTPNYREVALDGNFSLNGATLFVDPRVHGVRADGVAWIGSPLIEAGSLAGQLPATAAEFMTKGGAVTLATNTLLATATPDAANAPTVRIARDATIDFSGGWVSYAAGTVRTSRLIASDGRIVDISKADPNDVYVGVAEGFTEIQPRFGIVRSHLNAPASAGRTDSAYDEGRDAGALTIAAPAVSIDGIFHGDSFAGARQVAGGDRPSLLVQPGARALQASVYELPAGGALSIASMGDVLVYHGSRGAAQSNAAELLLNDDMLSNAGLSLLGLTASGQVTFAGANATSLQSAAALTIAGPSKVELAPGGALRVTAGRTIRFDGSVIAASGSITAETRATVTAFAGGLNDPGSIFRAGLYGTGTGDDLVRLFPEGMNSASPLDIVVGGSLSTAGLWVNDLTEGGIARGGAFSDGGSISLTVAPSIFAAIGTDYATATKGIDLSGSIRVRGRLNVASGGYADTVGGLVLDGRGGDVTLRNATVYASTETTGRGVLTSAQEIFSDAPFYGNNQSVDFTSLPAQGDLRPLRSAIVVDPRSTVDIAAGAIQGFGFAGGGRFTLVAPDISFGSETRAASTHIGLDFFRTTGFGTLDLSSYRSRFVDDLFTNAQAGKSAFLETTRLVVGAGETLDLTQWVLPSILSAAQAQALRGLATGADVTAQNLFAPIKPNQVWYQRAANLVLGGLTELDILAGGTISGAPQASITVSKLYNAGRIVLPGGSIVQRNDLPARLITSGLGVRDAALGGRGLADAFGGPIDSAGRFAESAANAAGIVDPANTTRVLTNAELVSREGADRLIHFLGLVDTSQGIVLDTGSVTDLSGVALFDPNAALRPSGERIRAGRVIDGGSISLATPREITRRTTATLTPAFSSGRTLVRRDGAAVDISGASGIYDQALGQGLYAPYLEWSAGGRISALGGGSLGTAPIDAHGGAANAEGGTLEWLRPTLGVGAGKAGANYLTPDLLTASGFDTLIARGSLTLDGDFSLFLRKALMVTSQDPTGIDDVNVGRVGVGATVGTRADVGANYVRLASRLALASNPIQTVGDGALVLRAGAQGFDLVGAISFDRSLAATTLSTPGDVRLSGVLGNGITNSRLTTLTGSLTAQGALTIDARRTYATTGTGNLQARLEGVTDGLALPYDIRSLQSIRFGNTYLDANAPAPLSAGTYLRVLAPTIVQDGYLAAPLGLLEIGDATTQSIRFGAGSVTTVSGAGLNVPYGTTTDLIEYFSPALPTPITRIPTGQLQLTAGTIVQDGGARIDGRGGGDLFAYEFQSGVGGSRDVLDRINRDAFSSNGYDRATGQGYLYPDQRQVFALVPVEQASRIALYDLEYSRDYGRAGPIDLYGAQAGLSVRLDAAPGVAAGEYLLLPAKYAMSIPGALRLVETGDAVTPLPGTSATLLDGSVIVGGSYGYAGTGIGESTRHSFTIQSKDVFGKYSSIKTTSGSAYIADKADKAGIARPRIPLDAARVVLSPLSELRLAGVFDTRAGAGGRGSEFDLIGTNIVVAAAGAAATPGAVMIADSALAQLNAASLLIGGRRSDAADGTTALAVTARSITVASGATLQAPELLLAVAGAGSQVTLADGAVLRAVGDAGVAAGSDFSVAGGGSLVRLSSGDERLVTRTGASDSTIAIGAASLSGNALTLDTSGSLAVAERATIAVPLIALSGQAIAFDDNAAGTPGAIGASLEAKLAAASRLTIRSPGAVRFSQGTHRFNDLVLDTAAIAATSAATGTVTLQARDVRIANSGAASDGCSVAGFCGAASALAIDARTVRLGANDVRAAGFADAVTVAGVSGIYVEAKGSFSGDVADLTLRAPFLADRSDVTDPRGQKVRADYTLLTSGDFALVAPTGAVAAPEGNVAPGARIAIGTIDARVASARIEGALVRATAGIIDVQAQGDVTLAGATLSAPGYQAVFGDAADPVTVSAGGGTINLLSRSGNLATDARSTLVSDSGTGSAGRLNLLAGNGTLVLDAVINPNAQGARDGNVALDAGKSAFDLGGFATRYGRLFGGEVEIRSGAGDLVLAAGQKLRSGAVTLVADGGTIQIGGTIDTSGASIVGLSADVARKAKVDGGDIALWGAGGVSLAATALLDTHTSGYADGDTRPASAGDVTIGIARSDAAITIAQGAVIDVGARRTQAALAAGESGARLIPEIITNPSTGAPVNVYRHAAPDVGGTVHFRAPVIGAAQDKVALSQRGTILGADSVQLEAFQRYDLDALAASGLYSGLTRTADGTLALSFAANAANSGGKRNPFTEDFLLADGRESFVRFIQGFGVSTLDGSGLDGMRLRPGIELDAAGAVRTDTQWNLAAAQFTPAQLQAAVDAGVLRVLPELGTNPATGQPYYAVNPGREGELLERHADFLYRVGGSARGEAPVVTLRAGGALTVNRSISDGFFTFRDKSDPAYVSYQLGGGNRAYAPAVQATCGTNNANCGTVVSYPDGVTRTPTAAQTLTIALNAAAQQGDLLSGAPFVNSPLALAGNGAAAGGEGSDSLGFAELFPLLSDQNAMRSSDLRLVAGAGTALSANPLQVDRARAADLRVAGEYAYSLTATGTVSFAGELQFQLRQGTNNLNLDLDELVDTSETASGVNALTADSYTALNWGTATTGLSADARAAAQRYFAGKGYRFVGAANAPSGIIAPLGEVTAFLQSFEPTYQAGLASGRTGYTANRTPTLLSYGAGDLAKAFVRTEIRTGDGAIALAAARDVDLRTTSDPVYRTETGLSQAAPNYGATNQVAQVGGSAVYTAGVRIAPVDIHARILGGGLVTLTPDSPYLALRPERVNFIPSPKGLSDTIAVLAQGGGDVSIEAGRDVLGRRDVWSEYFLNQGRAPAGGSIPSRDPAVVGLQSQRWRTGIVGIDTEIGIAPSLFSSGAGALAGGDVSVTAGRDVRELIVALDSGVTTTSSAAGTAMLTLGNGNLSLFAGRDIAAGRYDVAVGRADIHADRDVTAFGTEAIPGAVPQNLRIRITDAVVDLSARGSATIASVSSLGVNPVAVEDPTSLGFYSPGALFSLTANGTAALAQTATQVGGSTDTRDFGQALESVSPRRYLQVLPPSFEITAMSGSVALTPGMSHLLYPSPIGQLRLFSAGDIDQLVIAMSDAESTILGGAFSDRNTKLPYEIPYVTAADTDSRLRQQHNRFTTHLNDPEPVRIYSNGDILGSAIYLPKQARITAGGDIVDMYFLGQNVLTSDVTRIRAGGDILGTVRQGAQNPYVRSNNFILGGPGTLIVEAGRDLGPFVTSANIFSSQVNLTFSNAGGIRTVGSDYNPWLGDTGAALSVRFGMAAGADYAGLRDLYLAPGGQDRLDGDLFEQVTDAFGNRSPDRTRPIYAPLLAEWLQANAPQAFATIFGGQTFADSDAGHAARAQAAYGKFAELYAAFTKVDPLRQQDFLINQLYFNEIEQVGNPDGASYQQYVRGYRAVQALFPSRLGYTDNLALYTTDPATVSADHPLGEPVRIVANGQPQAAARVHTGDVDLRLATLQTGRGGSLNILGPGGDVIAGSVVRTSEQANRRGTALSAINVGLPPYLEAGYLSERIGNGFQSVPLGYEGVLTLRGGAVRSFTDGDFILNQSRVFTQAGGDIVMWSSNGNLNAGQGPKSASNFPPITVRFDWNGLGEVNSAGSVAGAGIGTFRSSLLDPPSDVVLIAPVGEVDAGDAGVRASGNVVVAAARVANADNFSAAGDITGVPSAAITATPVTPADANSAIAAMAADAAQANRNTDANRRSIITVDVLGPASDGICEDPKRSDDPDCR